MRTALLTTLLLAGCASAPSAVSEAAEAPAPAGALAAERPSPVRPTPWPEDFLEPAVLVANTITVLGPEGLFEHAVARSDDALYERRVEVIEGGRQQVVRPRPGAHALEIVRAQLDAWQLAAFREVVFVERTGSPVRVVATGQAVWRDPNGKEQRADRLVFEADLPAAE